VKKSLLHLLALTVASGIALTPSAHAFTEEIRAIETVIETLSGRRCFGLTAIHCAKRICMASIILAKI